MQFVETDMGKKVDSKFIGIMGGFVPMEMVVKGKFASSFLFFLVEFNFSVKLWY